MKNSKLEFLKTLKDDIVHGTSHSVEYLLDSSVEKTLSVEGIQRRKIMASLLRLMYKTQSEYKLIVDSDSKSPKYDGGKIYVINHRQADDIVLGVNAVADSGYIVFGNKFLALETLNGLGLWAYGVILLDRADDFNRMSTYEKMKYVIEHGGNIIIYPEGYWNLADDGLEDDRHGADDHNSDNWLIQDINIGVIRLAKETGCPIIPTILHYDEVGKKKCYSKKGDLFFVSEEEDIFEKKDQLVEIMQTMYYELMSKYSSYERAQLEAGGQTLKKQWELLKEELIAACNIDSIGYRLDLSDEKFIGKAKVLHPVIPNVQAFKHLDSLNYDKHNAFLLSNKYSGKY